MGSFLGERLKSCEFSGGVRLGVHPPSEGSPPNGDIAITIQEHPFMAGFKGTIARHKAQQIPEVFRAFVTQSSVLLKHVRNGCF
jgi:hypothetical protein